MDTASICFPDSGPLPIGFNFYVTKLEGSAKLLWETNSIDVLKFEVECSSDGVQFSSIASVDFVTGKPTILITILIILNMALLTTALKN